MTTAEDLIDKVIKDKDEATIKMRTQHGVGKRSKTKKVPTIEGTVDDKFLNKVRQTITSFKGKIFNKKPSYVVVSVKDETTAKALSKKLEKDGLRTKVTRTAVAIYA